MNDWKLNNEINDWKFLNNEEILINEEKIIFKNGREFTNGILINGKYFLQYSERTRNDVPLFILYLSNPNY